MEHDDPCECQKCTERRDARSEREWIENEEKPKEWSQLELDTLAWIEEHTSELIEEFLDETERDDYYADQGRTEKKTATQRMLDKVPKGNQLLAQAIGLIQYYMDVSSEISLWDYLMGRLQPALEKIQSQVRAAKNWLPGRKGIGTNTKWFDTDVWTVERTIFMWNHNEQAVHNTAKRLLQKGYRARVEDTTQTISLRNVKEYVLRDIYEQTGILWDLKPVNIPGVGEVKFDWNSQWDDNPQRGWDPFVRQQQETAKEGASAPPLWNPFTDPWEQAQEREFEDLPQKPIMDWCSSCKEPPRKVAGVKRSAGEKPPTQKRVLSEKPLPVIGRKRKRLEWIDPLLDPIVDDWPKKKKHKVEWDECETCTAQPYKATLGSVTGWQVGLF